MCFDHPIFHFWFLVTFGDEFMKIQNSYVIFVYILQDRKKMERKSCNSSDQNTQKQKMKIWDERYICHLISMLLHAKDPKDFFK